MCYLKLTPWKMSEPICIVILVCFSIMTVCGFVGALAAVFAFDTWILHCYVNIVQSLRRSSNSLIYWINVTNVPINSIGWLLWDWIDFPLITQRPQVYSCPAWTNHSWMLSLEARRSYKMIKGLIANWIEYQSHLHTPSQNRSLWLLY
jgi:hypothetical protein